jgi:hypothetical protein
VASTEHGRPAFFPGLSTAGARMYVGRDVGLPFTDDYRPPFPCTVTLRKVEIRSGQPGDARSTADHVDHAAHAD